MLSPLETSQLRRLFAGTLMALLQRERTQQGALVDASITAGTAYLGSLIYNINALDVW